MSESSSCQNHWVRSVCALGSEAMGRLVQLTAADCLAANGGERRLYAIGHVLTCLLAASAVVSQRALADLRAKDAESTPAPPRAALEDQEDNDRRRAPQSPHRTPDWVLSDCLPLAGRRGTRCALALTLTGGT